MNTSTRFWVLSCAVAITICVMRAALHPFMGESWQPHATDILSLLRSVLIIGALLAAGRCTAMAGQRALPWYCFAAGFACWFFADCIWAWLGWQGAQPWGSAADVCFLCMYPCVLAGIYVLPRARLSSATKWNAALDMAIISLAAGAALWVMVIAPSLAAGAGKASAFTQFIALAYPLGDLILVWAMLDLSFRGQVYVVRGVPLLLFLGLTLLVVADLLYAQQTLAGTYASGNSVGIVWCLSMCLIGLAGARQATGNAETTPARQISQVASSLLAAVGLIAVWLLFFAHPHSWVVALTGLGCALLMAMRQWLALAANRRMEAQLHAINADLELRIRERGAQLAEAQVRLTEAEGLGAVGRVAAAIAHDFNNVLSIIGGHGEIARIHDQEGVVSRNLDAITTAVERAAELAQGLMVTARPAGIAHAALVIQDIVHEVIEQIRVTLPASVSINSSLPKYPLTIYADGTQLHRVIMNLCTNARNAMRHGGVLGIQVEERGGKMVMIISDTGCGMDAATQQRLFEPYFTKRRAEGGSGIGLATVHAIVLQHGGQIDVNSTLGRGSQFTLTLPLGER